MTALASVILRGLAADRPAAGIAGRLYYSTDTEILERDNGATWDAYAITTRASCRVVRAASQTVSAATYTAASWDTESWDTDSMWAIGNPTRLVAPRTGRYLIGANLNFDTGTTGAIGAWLTKNGASPTTATNRRGGEWRTNGQDTAELSLIHPIQLTAGDYIELWVYSAGATNLVAGGDAEGSVAWMLEI